VIPVQQEERDLQVGPDPQGRRAIRETQGRPDRQGRQVLPDRMGQKVTREIQDLQVGPDPQVEQDPQDLQVQPVISVGLLSDMTSIRPRQMATPVSAKSDSTTLLKTRRQRFTSTTKIEKAQTFNHSCEP
jgi:hypothetical protein